MKKILALVLALCMLFGAVAMAEKETSGSTYLTATIGGTEQEETYTVVIPNSLDLTTNELSTALPIQVTAMQVVDGGNLTITVSETENNYKLVSTDGFSIEYALNGEAGDQSSGSAFVSHVFEDVGTKNIYVDITDAAWGAAKVGTYEDKVTFGIEFDSAKN